MAEAETNRDSVGAPAPEDTTRVASGATAPPESEMGERGDNELLSPTPPLEEQRSQAAAVEGPDEQVADPSVADPFVTEADHEARLEDDLEELSAKAQMADQYLELAQRTKADFENYRKRATRETAAATERGIVKLARELLPAVDNLDRALQAAEATAANGDAEADANLVSGIKLVHTEVLAALSRAGIERYSPEGERFDPQCHEAVAQQPVDGAEPGVIVEVYQRGYRLRDNVLRPARVVVAG